ncbi:MAG TPA: tetratricopeptide repeat protein [Rhizomicrobium sp.]|nr:tetratricopeptide repeat protein [Rhizomicrobium sp.]
MRKTNKIFPLLTAACLILAAVGPASARDSAEIAKIFDSGVAAYDAGNYEQAFKIWWDLRYEDLAAMRNLAMMLRKGQGVAKDPKKAEEIYQRAAEAGLPTAQADLADMLLKGEAGPPDLASALPLLEAAAAANHPVAQFQLGELYETGAPPFVPQNLEVARQLYTAAAGHGMKDAADRLRVVGPPMVQQQPVQAQPVQQQQSVQQSAQQQQIPPQPVQRQPQPVAAATVPPTGSSSTPAVSP